MMKLTVHNNITFPPAAGSSLELDPGIAEPFKAEATVSAGYIDITSIANWDLYGWATSLDYRGVRNELIGFVGDWGTHTEADKKTLVSHDVYPASTTEAELDTYWTAVERNAQRHDVRQKIAACDCTVWKSKDSEKFFLVELDDPGALVTTEITSDTVL